MNKRIYRYVILLIFIYSCNKDKTVSNSIDAIDKICGTYSVRDSFYRIYDYDVTDTWPPELDQFAIDTTIEIMKLDSSRFVIKQQYSFYLTDTFSYTGDSTFHDETPYETRTVYFYPSRDSISFSYEFVKYANQNDLLYVKVIEKMNGKK